MKNILISTGGSGGHVIPAINLFNHIKNQFNVTIYTDSRGAKFIPKEFDKNIFEVKKVPEKIYFFPLKIFFLFVAFIKSIINLGTNKFDIIISTGGYMSLPLVLASKIYGRKIFLFEPNSIIGRSNKFLLQIADKIFCYDKNLKGIKKKFKNKVIEIPPLLNKCYYKINNNLVDSNVLKILIFGGSQASLFFSKNLKNELIDISKKYKIVVKQQISQGFNINDYKKDYEKHNVENNLFYFEENFLCKENQFDIAISRSGASSLAELTHLNIPFIAIPYPHATDNHQYLNAKRYFDQNCCWILEEKNFNSGDICKIIDQIMKKKNEYLDKKNNLRKLSENISWEIINRKLIENLNEN